MTMGYRSADELPAPPDGKTGWPWTWTCGSHPETDDFRSPRSWPRVSIITPSYNQGQYIEETIRSVLLQGYPNLEYVIIDGASTDGTFDVIRKYEPFLTYSVCEPDRNTEEAINKGWKRCTGEIVAWIGSDDVYEPLAIANAVRTLLSQPEAPFCYGDSKVTDGDGNVTRVHRPGGPFSMGELLRSCYFHEPTVLIRNHALERVGGLNERLRYLSDWDLWLRLCGHGTPAYVPQCLAQVRMWEGCKTFNTRGYGRLERALVLLRMLGERRFSEELAPSVRSAVKYHYRKWVKNLPRRGRYHVPPQLQFAMRAFGACPTETFRMGLQALKLRGKRRLKSLPHTRSTADK